MNHLKYISTGILIILFCCCSSPKNFTYHYNKNYTGLDTLIRTTGYYICQRECDSSFFSMFMFYTDGLFTIATTNEIHPELVECFEKGGTFLSAYPQWGTYKIVNDTIKTQSIRTEEPYCVFFRDYKILPDGRLINISDYVEPKHTQLGFMKNYPSFYDNSCAVPAMFYPTASKRDSLECPFIYKSWFRQK